MAALSALSLSSTLSLTKPPPSIVNLVRSINLRRQSVRTAVSAKESAAPAPKKRGGGISKPAPITAELQAFVGAPEIARTQALKLIWAYIKEKQLQDPKDKKIILCDEKLKKLFGKEQVGFLEITKLLNPHFVK